MTAYYRPLIEERGQFLLAGGWCRFTQVEVLQRGTRPYVCAATDISKQALLRLTSPRPDLGTDGMHRPQVMGILNATPDSFSDGGKFDSLATAIAHSQTMWRDGADIIDIGGESTRPGADYVDVANEIARTVPAVLGMRQDLMLPLSIDTRKAAVAEATLAVGADWINDVSALSFDADMVDVVARSGAPICLMHAPSDPKTMQQNANYDDVLLDVYDYLEARIEFALTHGMTRNKIILDPGIGFGKILEHNLVLLRGLALFHGLGCPILLGASRKRFIGTISGVESAEERVPGSVAVALASVAQGVQIIRVHDVLPTVQALKLWAAVRG
jgi:dihydropteroate synthase